MITDSQFSLYLVGWKERADFPLGLLNQRLSIGFDPVFIDARFKADPGTGTELSVGVSMQSMFRARPAPAGGLCRSRARWRGRRAFAHAVADTRR